MKLLKNVLWNTAEHHSDDVIDKNYLTTNDVNDVWDQVRNCYGVIWTHCVAVVTEDLDEIT